MEDSSLRVHSSACGLRLGRWPQRADRPERAEFRGLDLNDLQTAYRQFCKNETVASSPIDLGEVIQYCNRTLDDLPDVGRLVERERQSR